MILASRSLLFQTLNGNILKCWVWLLVACCLDAGKFSNKTSGTSYDTPDSKLLVSSSKDYNINIILFASRFGFQIINHCLHTITLWLPTWQQGHIYVTNEYPTSTTTISIVSQKLQISFQVISNRTQICLVWWKTSKLWV